MMQSTKLEYEAALRAGLWQKDMAADAFTTIQRQIAADRNRRFWYVAATFAALVALVFATCSCAAKPAPVAAPTTRTIHETQASAVVIQALCQPVPGLVLLQTLGSGVIVSPNEILTAKHVVENPACTYVAVDITGARHTLYVAQWSTRYDVARMGTFAAFENTWPVELADPPPAGEEVCTVTWFPNPIRRCGDVQPFRGDREKAGDLVWDAIVEPGNSGSGVYDQRGRLVAIVTHYGRCTSGQYCIGRGTSIARLSWALGN